MKRTWTMIVLGFLSLWGGAAVASAQTSFRFVMWGGSRGSSSGVDTPIFSANSNQANGLSPKPLFTIFNGDLCYTFDSGCTSTGSSGWKYAINDGSPGNGMFNITFPIEGNHDLNASLWDTYWNGHSRALVTSIGGSNFSYYSGDSQNRTYSFDYSNSHFSLLDNQGGAASSLSSGQISWLDSDIAAAEARGVTHTFITTHGPIWTINSVPDTASSALIAVINKHPSISASLCGHEHVLGYAHIDSSRIRSVTHPWEEFVSGGSGAPLFSCNDNLSEYCISSYGFIVVDVNGSSFTMGIYLHGGGSTPIESWTFTKTTPASLTPTSVSFGSQPVGTTSLAQAITLTNGSGVATSISSIGITGSNSGDFAETNNCGSSLAAGAHCTINVTFTPTAINTRTATLTVTDSATNSPQTASLSGVGTSATATLSPTSLTFAGQAVGTTSAAQPVTLSNTSNATLSISSIALSGDFAQTNNCGSSLAANSSCAINVTFTPTAVGSRTGTLMVTDSASGSPQTVSLSGTGLGPNVTLSPGSLSFSSQDIGTTSSAKTLTLTSSGNQPLSISSIALSGVNAGDFAQSNNCPLSPSTLAASASCTINVTFAPTATGTRSATLAFSDNAPGSPQAVSLSGTGATPQASLTPFAVSFGNQKVGTSSASQTITLSNNVGKRLNISSIAITGTNSGDFRQTNNCGSRLSGQSSCTINVTFTPAAAGARAAALTVTDNASNSPQTASLSGTGTTGTVSLAPSTIPFGNQQVGTTSSPQAATLSNSGGSTVTISSIAITGTNSSNFGQTNNCGASLAAGASCTINVTFSPSVASSEAATLTVTDSDAGSPQTASLTGTGVTGTAALSPTSLTFSSQNVGTTSAAQTVTLTNSGGAALSISSIAVTGTNSADFGQTNNCGSSLAASSSCTINVTFTPAASGTRSGTLTVTDNASGSPQTASLTGTGASSTGGGTILLATKGYGAYTNSTVTISTITSSSFVVPVGDLLVAYCGTSSSSAQTPVISDSAGNTFVQIGPVAAASGGAALAMFYVPAAMLQASSSDTVTCTWPSAHKNLEVMALVYSGADPNAPLDSTQTGVVKGGTLIQSNPIASVSAKELIVAGIMSGSGCLIPSPGAGYTMEIMTTPPSGCSNPLGAAEDQVAVSAQSNVSASMTIATAVYADMIVATFKPAP